MYFAVSLLKYTNLVYFMPKKSLFGLFLSFYTEDFTFFLGNAIHLYSFFPVLGFCLFCSKNLSLSFTL